VCHGVPGRGLNSARFDSVFSDAIGPEPGQDDLALAAGLVWQGHIRQVGPLVEFGLLYVFIAREKALPFEPLVPNATTIAAMKEARQGGLKSFTTVKDLMADLDADD